MPTINGDAGNNALTGESGADTINGLDGNDALDGLEGNDTLNGGAGHDILFGYTGDDRLNGDDGDDILEGEAGNDILNGGAGFDIASYLNATASVTVNLGLPSQNTGTSTGTDTFTSIEGVYGSAFNDVLTGDGGANLLDGAEGADRLSGGGGDDILQAMGAEVVAGDWFSGGEGFDTLLLLDGARLNLATIGADIEALVSDTGGSIGAGQLDNFVYIDTASLTLNVAGVADLRGVDVYTPEFYLSVAGVTLNLDGNTFNAHNIRGSSGADVVYGGALNDKIEGNGGNDILAGGAGDDQILAAGGADRLSGDAGDDFLSGFAGDDVLEGGDGKDRLAGGDGADILRGGAGDDSLFDFQEDGSDHLYGGDGNDRLELSLSFYHQPGTPIPADVNVIDGGDGDDVFVLGGTPVGSMSYTLHGGAGVDRIDIGITNQNADYTSIIFDGFEELVGTEGGRFTAAQLDQFTYFYTGYGNNRIVTVASAGTVDVRDATAFTSRVAFGVGGVNFTAEGSQLYFTIFGSTGSDTFTGGLGADTVTGGAGNDRLDGGAGSTGDVAIFSGPQSQYSYLNLADGWIQVTGPDGVDLIRNFSRLEFGDFTYLTLAPGLTHFGQAAGETVNGTALRDTINGQGGNDVLRGFEGNDYLDGGAGDDRLEGGAGSNSLDGGAGNDIIDGGNSLAGYASGGDGNDWFANVAAANGGAGDDSYIGIAEIYGEDSASGTDSYYSFAASTSLTYGLQYIENLYFSWDGSQTPFGVGHQVHASHVGTGNERANIIVGASAGDQLYGMGGADVLQGQGGNDTLEGGDGTDTAVFRGARSAYTITATSFGAIVSGPDGVDTLTGIERLQFDDGLYSLAGAPLPSTTNGTAGADTINGTAGVNTVYGEGGDDTIRGAAGDDIIDGGAGTDTAVFSGLRSAYSITTISGVTTVTGPDGSDTLTNVERLQFDDGLFLWNGAPVPMAINGTSDGDIIVANAGSDIVAAGDGDDVITGAAGDDLIDGGAGTDTAIFTDAPTTVTVEGGVVTVTGPDGTDILTSVERLRFGAMEVSVQALLANSRFGSSTGETLVGGSSSEALFGLAGDDTLNGAGGDDTLNGGAGVDVLNGGAGFDTVDYGSAASGVTARLDILRATNDGDGGTDTFYLVEAITGSAFNDLLVGGIGDNTLRGGLGADLLLGQDGNDTLWGGSGVSNTLQGGLGDDRYVLEALDSVVEVAGQGTDTVEARINAYNLANNVENLIYGGTGAFSGTGNALNNVMTGGAGDDLLRGRGGIDSLVGGSGIDTADYSQAAAGVHARLDVMRAVNDGDGATDTYTSIEAILGSAFNDTLVGGVLGDRLSGGLGADTLLGMLGDDVLAGGQGLANQLQGGLGDDLYVLDAYDTIVELAGEGIDTIEAHVGAHVMAANVEKMFYVGNNKFYGTGNAGDNIITGGVGDDILKGMGGFDQLFGGAGQDEVQVRGSKAQYAIFAEGAGYRIVDLVAGRDGAIYVESIETLRFMTGNTKTVLTYGAAATPDLSAKGAGPLVSPMLADDAFVLPALDDKAGPQVLPVQDELAFEGAGSGGASGMETGFHGFADAPLFIGGMFGPHMDGHAHDGWIV
ncbi:beta strand repeat-containing protein [Brevundimonas lenta]|uniref:Ca2+-binding RTX toxin-like protein n=1 Tax=Brevundimonas lenta TaxID=424796 RepID=A0A7W6NNT5_9CAUL|nr:calcium-binding protein [Brevundimonas lenta]MBB4082710.1 Ca2+-binding RTX toxin-like protein [Brevundimonas lenta]